MMTSCFKIRLLTVLASCLASQALAAPVESMSLETFKDGAQRFWEVTVKCEASSQARLMRRAVDGDQWCSSKLADLCDKNKFSLSRQLCSDNYTNQVANRENSNQLIDIIPKPSVVQAEKIVKTADVKPPAPISEKGPGVVSGFNRSTSREDLRKEQMQIEEQRILIEEKRLELRRKELDLQKQQLDAS